MASEHTPGPWIVRFDNLGCKNIDATNGGQDGGIFTLSGQIGYTHGRADEDEDAANARLIAIAPEMHDELSRLCDVICDEDAVIVQALLAKATGGAS